MTLDHARHPEAERLAAYADDVLLPDARRELERHLADCADCRAVVTETLALLAEQSADKTNALRRRTINFIVGGLGLAAALGLAVRLAGPGRPFGQEGDRPELRDVVAAMADQQVRPIDGRLTGGFSYASPPSSTRGPGRSGTGNLALIAAAAARQRAADANPTGESLHDLGVAQLLLGQRDEALATLDKAVALRPRDAGLESDLASAYLARAAIHASRQDAEKALAAADLALAIEPELRPALFNRALAAEQTMTPAMAAAAWKAFITAETDQRWKDEAQRRLQALLPQPSS